MIIDEKTLQEVESADLTRGYTYEGEYVPASFYEEGRELTASDILTVIYYHEFTDAEMAQRDGAEAEKVKREIMEALPDAVAELSEAVSDTAINTAEVMDALAELSEIVSKLVEGE